MNRIFHARVPLYILLFIALVGMMALLTLLNRMPICGTALLLLLIVAIERVIHTTYTITADGKLVVSYGRFQRAKEIPLSHIKRVEKFRVFRIGQQCLLEYLSVFYDNEKQVTIMPVKEDEFLETLQKRRNQTDTKPQLNHDNPSNP